MKNEKGNMMKIFGGFFLLLCLLFVFVIYKCLLPLQSDMLATLQDLGMLFLAMFGMVEYLDSHMMEPRCQQVQQLL